MSKRIMIRIVSLSIAAVIITSGFALMGWQRACAYKRNIENNYQRAFSELVTGMAGINYALQKAALSNSPEMIVSLSSEVFRQSAAASSALSQMPLAQLHLEKTTKFISQIGDWAYSIAKSAAEGAVMTKEEREVLSKLATTAKRLNNDLNNLSVDINEGAFEFSELTAAESKVDKGENVAPAESVVQNIAYLEQEFQEYPTLVYDGPFSEHIDKINPAMLQGKRTVSRQEAIMKAAEFLGIDVKMLEYSGTSGGKIPVYTFNAERDGGDVEIDITCQGGFVLEMTDSRRAGVAEMNLEEATKKARDFLKKQGFGEMKESYWTVYADTVMINFAPVANGVVLYPDLVKVSIALDDGRVCNFESYGYIMNHREREIPNVGISIEDAKKRIVNSLEIKGHNLAVIPMSSGKEEFVYEMQCRREDGSHCLVYLDGKNGKEKQILILIEEENGVLAM